MSDCSSLESDQMDRSITETDDSDIENKNDFKFVVVEFTKRGPKRNKSVHVVCDSWISFDRKKIVVKYMKPPYKEDEELLIAELVKSNSPAPEDWPQYNCTIRGHAETYSNAIMKLRSLASKTYAFTSDSQVEPEDAAAAMETHYKMRTLQEQECQMKALMETPVAIEKSNKKQTSEASNLLRKHSLHGQTKPVNKNREIQNLKKKDDPHAQSKLANKRKSYKIMQEKSNEENKTVKVVSTMGSDESSSIHVPKKPRSQNHLSFESHQSNETFTQDIYERKKLDEISARCEAIEKNQIEIISLLRDQRNLRIDVPIEKNLSEEYNLRLPCRSFEDLDELNKTLKENKAFSEELKQSMMFSINRMTSIGKATAKILKLCLIRELAMKLTALRQMPGKVVIKSTPLYDVVFNILKNKFYPTINESMITSAIGDGLSNSKDWDGNRKNRS